MADNTTPENVPSALGSHPARTDVTIYEVSGAPAKDLAADLEYFIENVYVDNSAGPSELLDAFDCQVVDFPLEGDKLLVLEVVVMPAFTLVVELLLAHPTRLGDAPMARVLVTVWEPMPEVQ